MLCKQLKTGMMVEVAAFRGEVLKRLVVDVSGETAYLCKKEEWEKASREGREPQCVGFNLRFVMRVV